MQFYDGIIGLRIYGIGKPDLDFDTPLTLAHARSARLSGASLAGWEPRAFEIAEQGAARSYDELAGSYDAGPMAFAVRFSERTSRALLTWGGRVAKLAADIDEDDSTITLDTAGLAGRTLHIGRETIKLGTEGPAGTYTTSDRGRFTSPQRVHKAGAWLHDHPVWWVGRDVALVTVHDGVERIRWRGQLTSPPRGNEDATLIVLEASDAVTQINAGAVNRSPADLRDFGTFEVRRGIDFDVVEGCADGYVRRTTKAPACRTIALQVGQSLYVGDYLATTGSESITLPGVRPELRSGEVRLTNDDSAAARVPVDTPVREVFVVDADLDALYASKGGVSPTYRTAYPYHPLTVALAVLTSTAVTNEQVDVLQPDVLTPAWSQDLLSSLDLSAWELALRNTPEQRVSLVWGWDGESIALTQVLELLRAWGWVVAQRENGTLYPVPAARPVSIVEAAAAPDVQILSPRNGGTFAFDPGQGVPIAEVVGEVGGRPWGVDPLEVTVEVDGEASAESGWSGRGGFTLDMSSVRPDDVVAWGAGIPNGAVAALSRYAIALTRRTPTLNVRAADPVAQGVEYDLGAVVRLRGGPSDPRLPRPDGTLVTLDGADDTLVLGRIVSSAWEPRDGTHTLTLRLDAYRSGALARLRAPSAVISALDSGSVQVTLDGGEGFGTDGEAFDTFREGDQLRFVRVDGSSVAEQVSTPTINDINGPVFTLSSWPFSSDPSVLGLAMRIAPSDEYNNTAHVAGETRPFVHLASDAGEIDHDGGVQPADVYG